MSNSEYYLSSSAAVSEQFDKLLLLECIFLCFFFYSLAADYRTENFTRFFRGATGDSNFTERISRRSVNGVLGVECTSDGSDLN